MQTEIRQERSSGEKQKRGRKKERDRKRKKKRASERERERENESTVASGSWSTDSAQRISILYLAKGATNHLGRLSGVP